MPSALICVCSASKSVICATYSPQRRQLLSQVTDITYSNGGADATLTVIRDIANSGQETFHNNAVFKKLSDLTILPIRNRATHASANAAVFTAGDSESAGTKGLVTGVVGGTANYTSTLSAVVGTVAVTVA